MLKPGGRNWQPIYYNLLNGEAILEGWGLVSQFVIGLLLFYLDILSTVCYLELVLWYVTKLITVLKCFTMKVFLKGKAQYSWPPCTKQSRSGPFIHLFTKQFILMWTSSVLSLFPQLVFPGFTVCKTFKDRIKAPLSTTFWNIPDLLRRDDWLRQWLVSHRVVPLQLRPVDQ